MPQNWASTATQVVEGPDDWDRYTVTKDDYMRYSSAAGFARLGAIDHSSSGRLYGNVSGMNFMRTQPQPALTLGADAVIFNDSSARQALATSEYRNFYGCGQ
jgi:hypothetical protein